MTERAAEDVQMVGLLSPVGDGTENQLMKDLSRKISITLLSDKVVLLVCLFLIKIHSIQCTLLICLLL